MAKVAAIALTVGIAGMFAAPAQADDAPAQAATTATSTDAPAQAATTATDTDAPAQAATTATDTDAPSRAIDELFQDPPVLLPGLLSEGSADASRFENSFNNSFNCATIFNVIGMSCNKIERPDPPKIENKVISYNTNDNANNSEAEAKARCNQDDKGKGLCRPGTDAATVDAEADDAAESATDTVPATTADAPTAE